MPMQAADGAGPESVCACGCETPRSSLTRRCRNLGAAPGSVRYVDLNGTTALVTGGSGGIGAALSRRLAEAGVAVAVHHRDSETEARAAGGALVVGADLADMAACEDLVARVEASS